MFSRRDFLLQSTAVMATLTSARFARAALANSASLQKSMSTRAVPGTDLVVSAVAYGTGMLDTSWHDPEFISKAARAIRAAYENGITFFDLADTYGHGKSEKALGTVLKASPGLRDRIVIQSKCDQVLSPKWSPENPGQTVSVNTSREHILSAVEGSLTRLGVEQLDILLLHMPDPAIYPQEVAQAFDQLHQSGKVRYFGVSNHRQEHIELLLRHVRQPLVVNQIRLGIGHYSPALELIEYCQQQRMQIQAYSPLRARKFSEGNVMRPTDSASSELKELSRALYSLARKKDTNASAIALAWLLQHPAGIVPIIGTSNPEYIKENCASDQVKLSDDEWRELAQLSSRIE